MSNAVPNPKVSIVIICWNDSKYIVKCIESVLAQTLSTSFEIIVTDNGSTDGSVALIRGAFPGVRIVENGRNLGFAGANNRAFDVARGEYVLILNPDTVICDRAIDKTVAFADSRPQGGAFGCRMINPDGSYQRSAYPVPSIRGSLIAGLNLRRLEKLSSAFTSEIYYAWEGTSERTVGFMAGCYLLIRRDLLAALKGFDERLFFQTEDADLCLRVSKMGRPVIFFPGAEVIHIGGHNRGCYPTRVMLETQRSFYRFFFKHYGFGSVRRLRWVMLLRFGFRAAVWRVLKALGSKRADLDRLKIYTEIVRWHWRIDPVRFIKTGEEPETGFSPLGPIPRMIEGGPVDPGATAVRTL